MQKLPFPIKSQCKNLLPYYVLKLLANPSASHPSTPTNFHSSTQLFRTIDLGRIDDIPNKPIPINNRGREIERERIKTKRERKKGGENPWRNSTVHPFVSLITKQLGRSAQKFLFEPARWLPGTVPTSCSARVRTMIGAAVFRNARRSFETIPTAEFHSAATSQFLADIQKAYPFC